MSYRTPDSRSDDIAAPAKVSIRVVLLVLFVGAICAGGVFAYSKASASVYTAAARVLVSPDPTISGPATSLPSSDENNIYMQSQVIAVESLGARSAPGADLTVQQAGQSNMLEITASTRSAARSVRAANSVLDAYLAARRRGITTYATSAVKAISDQVDSITAELALKGSNAGSDARRGALTSEYSRLVSLRNQVELTAQTARPTNVVTRASLSDVSVPSNGVRNAILAGLLGALLTVGAIAAGRRIAWRTKSTKNVDFVADHRRHPIAAGHLREADVADHPRQPDVADHRQKSEVVKPPVANGGGGRRRATKRSSKT